MVSAGPKTPVNTPPKIVLIGGPSGGGKTTFAHQMLAACDGRAVLISTDNYYLPLQHLALENRTKFNFDHPDAIEFDLLVRDLELLKAGRTAEIPTYDFAAHARTALTVRVEPRPIVIVEGILALVPERLRSLSALRIFVHSPTEICLTRRSARDIRERGRTMESVMAQWEATVLPMYHEFVAPSEAYADVVIAGNAGPAETAAAMGAIMKKLRA